MNVNTRHYYMYRYWYESLCVPLPPLYFTDTGTGMNHVNTSTIHGLSIEPVTVKREIRRGGIQVKTTWYVVLTRAEAFE